LLDTYTPIFEKEVTEQESLVRNWNDIKHEVQEVIEYRLYSSNKKWYKDRYEETLFYVNEFYPLTSRDVDYLPQGILAEVFFLNACKQNGIRCKPCTGDEDVRGADFKIVSRGERSFFDVSMNSDPEIFKQKIDGSNRYPTLFLGWLEQESTNGKQYVSYASKYLEEGYFNGREFLQRVITSGNYHSKCLKRAIEEEKRGKGCSYSQFSGSSIEYIEELDRVLSLLSKNI
jgi:hypothetical protein